MRCVASMTNPEAIATLQKMKESILFNTVQTTERDNQVMALDIAKSVMLEANTFLDLP
jgi:hypothetical protein